MTETEEAQNVGELLRNTRLKRGKTLSDVSRDLCIRKVYLEAIENLDSETLPPVPYGVGFVRTYSEYLDLNSAQVVLAYKQASRMPERETLGELSAAEREPDAAGPDMRHILIALTGIIAVVLIWSFFAAKSEPERQLPETAENVPEPVIIEEDEPNLAEMGIDDSVPAPDTETEKNVAQTSETDATTEDRSETALEPETKISETASSVENNTDSAAAAAEPAEKTAEVQNLQEKTDTEKQEPVKNEQPTPTTVRMVLQGPSWIELRQKNKVILSGIYAKGFTYDIPDSEDMVVSVGRYYNVDFYVNGKLTKIASSLKQMNINLNKYIIKTPATEE